MTRWNGDDLPDLLLGLADGRVAVHLNVGAPGAPLFDAGTILDAGGATLDIGARATPVHLDWDGDGRRDLVIGAYDGRVQLCLNTGADDAPVFAAAVPLATPEGDLVVPTNRAAPAPLDFDGDGRLDLLAGNTAGQVLVWRNVGPAADPRLADFGPVTSGGVELDLAGTPRSRPAICDWNADGHPDLLVGAGDGYVRLYLGYPNSLSDAPPILAAARFEPPWPNPFNPAVNLAFELAAPGRAALTVHDAAGREVARLHDGELPDGRHVRSWDGRDAAGRSRAAGVYLVRLVTPAGSSVRTVTLVK